MYVREGVVHSLISAQILLEDDAFRNMKPAKLVSKKRHYVVILTTAENQMSRYIQS